MKTIFLILIILVITVIAVFFVLGKQSQKEQVPGLINGKLSQCSTKPNCVCSEYPDNDKHFIEPIQVDESQININKIETIITEMGGSVINKTEHYIAATFTSAIFGFVDSFEIRIEPNTNSLYFRSGSRVGYSDRGVNKKRVELFKQLYQQ